MLQATRCSKCGKPLKPGFSFCSHCGAAPLGAVFSPRLPIGSKKAGCVVTGTPRKTILSERYPARDIATGTDMELVLILPPVQLSPTRLENYLGYLHRFERLGDSEYFRRVHSWTQDQGAVFVALEPVQGPLLSSKLVGASGAFKSLEKKVAREVSVDLCRAVELFHEEMPYGGISPDRVFLEYGRVPVLDLPVEPWLVPDYRTWPWLSYFDACCLAPELLQGENRPSVSSDIFGLGALAFHIFTGMPLAGFSRDKGPEALALDEAFVEVVARAISERPSERYLSVKDLRRDLENALLRDGTAKKHGVETPEEGNDGTGTTAAMDSWALAAGTARNQEPGRSRQEEKSGLLTGRGLLLLLVLVLSAFVLKLWFFNDKESSTTKTAGGDRISRQPFLLVVESKPMGVSVNVDGTVLGVTPLKVRLEPSSGKHYVRLSKRGYVDVLREMELIPGDKRKLFVELKKIQE